MIKTFIFAEDGSVDIDELKERLGDDVLVVPYRQGATPPQIQQPREPVSEWADKAYSETKKVLENLLDGNYKMSQKLRQKLDELYGEYYA